MGLNAKLQDINISILQDLNPEQLLAVTSLGRPLLVLSGAGTGKTKVLTTRVSYILSNGLAFPSQILAVTFSNRAAIEMKTRIQNICGNTDGILLGTFHAICARILRRHSSLLSMESTFTILDADDQLRLIKQILVEHNFDKKFGPSVLNTIARWKDKGLECNQVNQLDKKDELSLKIYKTYQERLISYNAVDFGDLLLNTIKLLRENNDISEFYNQKLRHILVDEYQDTNVAQYILLRLLCGNGEGFCCVGDDDQAIYSWRGAEIGNILRFEKDFPNCITIKLEQNYRSSGHILGAASSLIAKNNGRFGKVLWTNIGDGNKVIIKRLNTGFEEAQYVFSQISNLLSITKIKFNEIAILVRAGFQTREFEEKFIANGIPYRIVGGQKFYERMEIKDAIAYLRLIYQPNDALAFQRIVNVPKRGIGPTTIKTFLEFSQQNNISLFQSAHSLLKQNKLRPSLKKEIENFISLIDENRKSIDSLLPAEIAKNLLEKSGYIASLQSEKTPEAKTRIENLKELISALEDFQTLESFLEHVSLVTDIKERTDNLVSIMTIHASKGLEFQTVFLAGWEEGVFPHILSLQENNVEEERRLAYVGLTRAKRQAFITYSTNRRIHNQWQSNLPSRFLKEISTEHINK